MLLSVLQGRFRFLTIPELLRHGSADRQPWFRGAHRIDRRSSDGIVSRHLRERHCRFLHRWRIDKDPVPEFERGEHH